MLKIAVDNQISHKVVQQLKDRKFDVVIWAGDKTDEEWVYIALGLGATVFVSPDVDIPILLDKFLPEETIHWINVPQGLKSKNQLKFIIKRLKVIK